MPPAVGSRRPHRRVLALQAPLVVTPWAGSGQRTPVLEVLRRPRSKCRACQTAEISIRQGRRRSDDDGESRPARSRRDSVVHSCSDTLTVRLLTPDGLSAPREPCGDDGTRSAHHAVLRTGARSLATLMRTERPARLHKSQRASLDVPDDGGVVAGPTVPALVTRDGLCGAERPP